LIDEVDEVDDLIDEIDERKERNQEKKKKRGRIRTLPSEGKLPQGSSVPFLLQYCCVAGHARSR
jgi:hypothetical protein